LATAKDTVKKSMVKLWCIFTYLLKFGSARGHDMYPPPLRTLDVPSSGTNAEEQSNRLVQAMIGGLQASGSIKMIMDIKNPEAVIASLSAPEPKCKPDGDTCWLGKDICCEGLECHQKSLLQGICQPPYHTSTTPYSTHSRTVQIT